MGDVTPVFFTNLQMNMKHIYIILTTLIVCGTTSLLAQEVRGVVSGTEPDGSKTALKGATVRWLGSSTGTITKNNGVFSIARVPHTDTLVTSFTGYKTDTTIVPHSTQTIEITLQSNLTSDKVVVEADAPTISKATAKTEEISQHKLEQSACCSLAESFEKSPSVEVTYADAATGAKQIQLLGLRGIYTQTMTEAIPTIRGLATPFGLDYIPGAFIEGISISKGAASVMNGYEGITGQINIEYKKPQEEGPLFVNAYGNHMGRAELNVTSAQHLSDSWHTMVMLHGRTFNHEQDGNGDGFIDMPKFNQLNGVVRLFHHSENNTEFQLVGKALHDEYTGGTMTHGMQDQTDHSYAITTRTNRYEVFGKFALNPLFEEPTTHFGLQVSAVVHDMQSMIGKRSYLGKQKTFQAKAIFSTEFTEELKLNYGASYVYDDISEAFLTFGLQRAESIPGLFAEVTYSGIENLTVVGGIRADKHNLYGTIITPRVHAKYAVSEMTSLRVSAGSGMRVANPISDNLSSYVNSRAVVMDNVLNPERAWNYGASVTSNFEALGTTFTFDAEVYRTDFSNQVVVDFDKSPRELYITNLNGTSYANSALAQLQFDVTQGINLNIAYRLIDAQTTTAGVLQQRPLISPHRVLGSFSYYTEDRDWQVDGTMIWNSGGRIPSTAINPDSMSYPSTFTSYFRMNAQLTKRFGVFDAYLGVENITNVIQQQAIISPNDPHSTYFDGSLIWGPLDNRTIYLGIRYRME